MLNFDVNYVAVLVAALANMALGFLWYSKILFGARWIALMKDEGKDVDAMMKEGGNAGTYVASFVGALVTAFILAAFVSSIDANTLGEGLTVGFLAWLGFVLITGMQAIMYESRSKGVFLISTAYNLASLVLMGAIIGAWQ